MHIHHLFDDCFFSEDIHEGDLFPAGKSSVAARHIVCDFDNFFPSFAVVAERYAGQNRLWWTLREEFERDAPDADADLLFALQTYVGTFEAKRRVQQTGARREALFEVAAGLPVALSCLLERDCAGDIEQALFAHRYLKSKDIDSLIYVGLRRDEDVDGARLRAFLSLSHQQKDYIFDPFEPTLRDGRDTVALFEAQGSGVYEDVLSRRRAYFSTGAVPMLVPVVGHLPALLSPTP